LRHRPSATTLGPDLVMDRPELGYYRIEGIVGCGRTGIVYLATDSRNGRAVALKVLREDVSVDPVYRERFRREGSLLAGLQHPHVMPIYDMGEVDGELYIAARLVSGNLKGLIVNDELTVDDAMGILMAVAEAIDAAHAAGIVHRDIKPANVLVDPGPQVFLGDFGLARDPQGAMLTVPGQILGTLDYMAPEHLEADGVGTQADIYAFACLAVETLTGEVPFPRGTDAAVMYAHVVDPPPSVSERRPELPAALDDVIAAGMAKDPDERPPTARALLTDMLRALGRPVPARLVPAV
jgi:serine/threonine protein kinase